MRSHLRGAAIAVVFLAFCSCSHDKAATRLPFGGVNSPVAQQIVTGKMDVTGWALAEGRIGSVSVYIDRSFVAECATGQPRPDVAKLYPDFVDSGASGWTATVDSMGFAAGWHEVTVQAKSRDGATRDLASLPILIRR